MKKAIALIVALLPVAYIYSFNLIFNNFGNFLIFAIALPLIILESAKGKFVLNKCSSRYLYYSFYLLIMTLMAFVFYDISQEFGIIMYIILMSITVYLLLSIKGIENVLIKYYTFFSTFFSAFLLVQFLAYYLFSIPINGQISFLPLYEGKLDFLSQGRILRMTSVFKEPSHFALYNAPAVVIYAWNIGGNIKFRKLRFALTVVAVFLSGSGNGFVFMCEIILLYIIYFYFQKLKLRRILFGAAIVIVGVVFISKSPFFKGVKYGLFVAQVGQSESKSEGRVYRGFKFYYDLPIVEKLIGVGYRNAGEYASKHNPLLYRKYYIEVFDYFNTIAGVLIYSGIIGFILFIIFIISMWQKSTFFGSRTLILIVCSSMVSSSIYMTELWPLYISLLMASTKLPQLSRS